MPATDRTIEKSIFFYGICLDNVPEKFLMRLFRFGAGGCGGHLLTPLMTIPTLETEWKRIGKCLEARAMWSSGCQAGPPGKLQKIPGANPLKSGRTTNRIQ